MFISVNFATMANYSLFTKHFIKTTQAAINTNRFEQCVCVLLLRFNSEFDIGFIR